MIRVVFTLFCVAAFGLTARAQAGLPEGVKIVFGPDEDVEKALIKAIDAAKVEILVSEYVITNQRIADALVRAYRQRKVVTALILDASPAVKNYTTPLYLAQRGLPVVLLDRPNNSRYMVIDRQILVTGSADWTNGVNRSHENLLMIQEPSIALTYRREFTKDLDRGKMVDASGSEPAADPTPPAK